MRKITIILFLLSYHSRIFAVVVNIEGLTSAKGQVCLTVMIENKNTLWQEEFKVCQIAKAGRMSFEIPNQTKPYALKAYHDTNQNEKIDYYFFLFPKEGLGYSKIESPFRDFSLTDALLNPNLALVTVHMHYLLH